MFGWFLEFHNILILFTKITTKPQGLSHCNCKPYNNNNTVAFNSLRKLCLNMLSTVLLCFMIKMENCPLNHGLILHQVICKKAKRLGAMFPKGRKGHM